jgi:hypothetical protein
MKYFTLNWWMGQCEGDAAKEYLAYLEDVRDLLPQAAQRLEKDVSIHDAKLIRLDIDIAAGTLLMVLDGFDWTWGHFPLPQRTITLKYGGVSWVRSLADPKSGLPGPHGYGDLGYWEFEALGDGLCEHRMLFSTGIEIHIRFRELSID